MDEKKNIDKAFIARLVRSLNKLEPKYLIPEHERRKILFARKQKTSHIIPKEYSSILYILSDPDPLVVTVPNPYPHPHVRWSDVR